MTAAKTNPATIFTENQAMEVLRVIVRKRVDCCTNKKRAHEYLAFVLAEEAISLLAIQKGWKIYDLLHADIVGKGTQDNTGTVTGTVDRHSAIHRSDVE